MPYVKLPANIKFSSSHKVGENRDAFDILVDGKPIHTFEYGTYQVMGNMSEEVVIARAHVDAKDWLRKNDHLPAGE